LAKREPKPELIEEIESGAERLASWIGENALAVCLAVALVLSGALGWGVYDSWKTGREEAASNALDSARSAYFNALGAGPLARAEPELANPLAAQTIREEHLGNFLAVADTHEGTVAGTLALFEAGQLQQRLELAAESEATWARALAAAAAAGNPGLQGLAQQRLAEALEARGAWAEAASAHEAAGAIADYPLRYWALVDAARCWNAAGDDAQALALYERVADEAPEFQLPPHLAIERAELEATQGRLDTAS